MSKIAELEKLVKTFSDNFSYYKQPKNNYNEQTTRDDFIKDRLFQHACSMALQTIGEASRSFSDAFITEHQEVAWKLIKGMRNFFAHSYHISIDMDKVWMMVHRDIPLLKAYCVNILKENHCDVFLHKHTSYPMCSWLIW